MKLLCNLTTSFIVTSMIFLGSFVAHGYIYLSVPHTIDFNSSSSAAVPYTGNHAGNNEYSFNRNVAAGTTALFTVNVTSVTGDPDMVLVMVDPNNSDNFWAIDDPKSLELGQNTVTWGPFGDPVGLKYMIRVDADDSVTFDQFDATYDSNASGGGDTGGGDTGGGDTGGDSSGTSNNITISDTVSLDFNNGVTGTTDVVYSGSHAGENQYAYSIDVAAGENVNFSINATSVTGDPRMQILMFNPANNAEYWAASDPVDIVQGTNSVAWGEGGFSGDVHLKFTILLDSDDAVTLDSFVVTDSGDGSGGDGGNTDINGVRFVFESESGGNPAYDFETDTVEITGNTSQAYSITIPAYVDTDNSGNTFSSMLLYAIGSDQPLTITDVTLVVNGVTYGGTGTDSLLFDNIFGGVDLDDTTYTYTMLSTSESWGGFALSNSQVATFPSNGLVFNSDATLTFSAYLDDGEVSLPPQYNGETAFSNGVIDTSEDTGTGRDDDPAYKWSAYVSWHTLEAGDTQGTYVGGDNWGRLSDLPATWSNGVITLAPNTASYNTWSEEGSDDGIHFLEQTLKIEGTQGTSAILGKTVNFSGTVDSYTLDDRYTVTVFVKALDPASNYAPIVIEQVELSGAGNFAISADLPSGDYVPQLGFLLTGRNANPDTDWGNIQISNVAGSYDETTSIRDGNFTDGANAYWGFTPAAVEFNTNGGNGSVPGQVVMTNGTTNRASAYIVTNTENLEPLANFGMQAGNTYEVTYYMNRVSGSDLGLIQFYFDTGAYLPADFSANVHGDANPESNTWVQYTQTVEVPASATQALFYVISGANSVIAFDQINVAEVANNFASWAADNGLSGTDASFTADPDGDGIPNGLESFLGTLPSTMSSAMSNIAKTSNGISLSHSRNSDLASDITASYQWSTDLSTWSASGETVNGTTVTITTDDSVPGTTAATATVSGTEADNVFIKVNVSND